MADYLLLLPQEWRSKVMLEEAGQGGWTLRHVSNGESLLSWQVVRGRSPGNEYQLLGRLGESSVYARFGEDTTPEEQQSVVDGFLPLYE